MSQYPLHSREMKTPDDSTGGQENDPGAVMKVTKTMQKIYACMRGPLASDLGPMYCRTGESSGSGLNGAPQYCFSDTSEEWVASSVSTLNLQDQGQELLQPSRIPIFGRSPSPYSQAQWQQQMNDLVNETNLKGPTSVESMKSSFIFSIRDQNYAETNFVNSSTQAGPDSDGEAPGLFKNCSVCADDIGPRVLSKSELSVVYGDYMAYLDDRDHEGDPRNLRITPETFASWAECAGKVDIPHRKKFEVPKTTLRKSPREKDKERSKLTVIIPQYDQETGEVLSPSYDLDDDPIPLLSPQGVNIDQCPASFAYSFPHDDLEHKKAAYFDANIVDFGPSLSPDRFTVEGVYDALESEGDPMSGVRRATELEEKIKTQVQDRDARISEARRAAALNDKLEQQVIQFRQHIGFLRRRFDELEKVVEKRRYLTHYGQYMEGLTQETMAAAANARIFHESSAKLREEAGNLVSEQKQWLERVTALEQQLRD